MDASLTRQLRTIVGADNVLTAKSDRITHSYDATQEMHLPEVVVYAETTEEVSAVLRLANENRVAVLPRGAGSGFTGGTLPVHGGIVLVLTKMDEIRRIDPANLIAVVQPGVVTADFQKAVEKLGLFYPPDPASKEFSTMGGNVAECAGGPRCLKYGVTKDYILGLEVVMPSGEIIRTGGETLKNVVGYDLTKLIVGSEGTLGVVTEIIVRLIPKPEGKKTLLIQFATIEGAARAVADIIGAKIIPTTLEFMDAATIDCIRDTSTIPIAYDCQAILIIEVDGDLQTLDDQAIKVLSVIAPDTIISTRTAETDPQSEEIWQVRRRVSPSLRKINPHKFNEDIVVPRSRLPEMIRTLEHLSRVHGIPIVNFGHAGDGNIHVNIMVDLAVGGMAEKVEGVMEKIFRAALDLRGAISGEHGIGTAKARYMGLEYDKATIDYMWRIKKAWDPNGILNPGKIFMEKGQPTRGLQGKS